MSTPLFCASCHKEIPKRKQQYYTDLFYKKRYECCSSDHVKKANHRMYMIMARYPELALYDQVDWKCFAQCFEVSDKYRHIYGWAYYPCYILKGVFGIEQRRICDLVKLGHKYAKLPLKDFMPKEIKVDLPVQRHVMAFQQVDVVEFSIFL